MNPARSLIAWAATCGAAMCGPAFSEQTTITGYPSDSCAARVEIFNAMTDVPGNSETTIIANGISLHVLVTIGDGAVPDEYEVQAPPGFVVIPEKLVLAEEQKGTVLVCEGGVGA